jgi:hypothetical protein
MGGLKVVVAQRVLLLATFMKSLGRRRKSCYRLPKIHPVLPRFPVLVELPSAILGMLASSWHKTVEFISNLYNTPNFEKGEDFKKLEQILPDLAIDYKRTVVVFQTCKEFFTRKDISRLYRLDKNVLAKVIERYIEDLGILKKRHGCRKVQLPKIAGLMTNLIVKYRPITPIDIKNNPYLNINETFAIFHAICICADFSGRKDEVEKFGKSPQHDEFYEDMIYHLNRN